ncbi:MAG: cell surface protein SprA, partial [Calditrichota bacterium]
KPPVKVTVINTNDNPDYKTPPGVSGELDPVTNLRAQEQSLALKIERLGTGETGIVHKHLQTRIDLLDYRYLKMFVHGGGPEGQLTDRFGQALDMEIFIRLASDTARAYYEYSERIQPGWHKDNEIILSLDRIASVKFLREKDSLRNYDILPDGDVIRVVGDPSLSAITDIVIGVKNHGQEITELDNVEIWLDEFRVAGVNRDPGWAARGGVDLKFADFLSIHGDITQEQANFHDVSQRRGDNSDQLSATANTRLSLDRFLDANWGVQIPFSVKISQSVTVPKFKPKSDIKLTAISGEKIDVWSIFQENLFTDRYLSEHPQYQSPTDSLISVSKSYSYATSYSKTKKSDNPWVRYTLDNFRFDGSYAESYKSDDLTQLFKRLETRGKPSYDFALDKPIEISWLGWAGRVPVLKKLSESKFRPLPSALSVSADGNESYDYTLRRRGLVTPRYTYTIDRSLNTRWNPFDIVNISFDQSARANRMKDDSTRTRIAEKLMEMDSTRFWVRDERDSLRLDSSLYRQEYQRALEKMKDLLFWDLFGAQFIDNGFSQNLTFGFQPQLVSWLTTDFTYNSRYRWDWTDYGQGDRSVSVNSSLTTSLTLRLQQILGGLGGEGGSNIGQPPLDGKGMENYNPRKDKFGSPGLKGENPFKPDQWRDPLLDQEIPGKFGDLGTNSPSDKPIPGELPPVLEDESTGGGASDSVTTALADTTQKKAPRKRVNPLKLMLSGLSKLRDIRWDYTLSNDTRNNSVERGQAEWIYRLGFTRDPGLGKAPGFATRDSYSRTDDHR